MVCIQKSLDLVNVLLLAFGDLASMSWSVFEVSLTALETTELHPDLGVAKGIGSVN